jgi:hypothetical protein
MAGGGAGAGEDHARRNGAARPGRVHGVDVALTLAEAGALLGLSVRAVQRLIGRGYLRPFFLPASNRPRIPMDQVLAIRARTERDGPPRRLPGTRKRNAHEP